ncbi:uncharacterized protein LOC124722191 [Schistocerca piceifrons]|uniref:uncharacterized protein LOC124722191 n=1 Tax=Schistocerca piceifrons TaxID=274613 RepID=UPI001F5FB682|nr:uncharacterized protein LOC124722191 [Schistocerca piceifrons]
MAEERAAMLAELGEARRQIAVLTQELRSAKEDSATREDIATHTTPARAKEFATCAKSRFTRECTKPRDAAATRSNCGGSHAANYRGCSYLTRCGRERGWHTRRRRITTQEEVTMDQDAVNAPPAYNAIGTSAGVGASGGPCCCSPDSIRNMEDAVANAVAALKCAMAEERAALRPEVDEMHLQLAQLRELLACKSRKGRDVTTATIATQMDALPAAAVTQGAVEVPAEGDPERARKRNWCPAGRLHGSGRPAKVEELGSAQSDGRTQLRKRRRRRSREWCAGPAGTRPRAGAAAGGPGAVGAARVAGAASVAATGWGGAGIDGRRSRPGLTRGCERGRVSATSPARRLRRAKPRVASSAAAFFAL